MANNARDKDDTHSLAVHLILRRLQRLWWASDTIITSSNIFTATTAERHWSRSRYSTVQVGYMMSFTSVFYVSEPNWHRDDARNWPPCYMLQAGLWRMQRTVYIRWALCSVYVNTASGQAGLMAHTGSILVWRHRQVWTADWLVRPVGPLCTWISAFFLVHSLTCLCHPLPDITPTFTCKKSFIT